MDLADPDRWTLPGAVGELVDVLHIDTGVDFELDRGRELDSRHGHG